MSHGNSKQRSFDSHKAYIMKFYWTTGSCTLALLEQKHQVTAFCEYKITEECSRFYSKIPSVYVFKKAFPDSHNLTFAPISMQVSKHFQIVKGVNAWQSQVDFFFFLKACSKLKTPFFVKTAASPYKFNVSKRMTTMLSCMVCNILSYYYKQITINYTGLQ